MNEVPLIPFLGGVLTQNGSRPWWITQFVLGSANITLELFFEGIPDEAFLNSGEQFVLDFERSEKSLRIDVANDIALHYSHTTGSSKSLMNELLVKDMVLKTVARWEDGDFLLTYELTELSLADHRFVIGQFDVNRKLEYTDLS